MSYVVSVRFSLFLPSYLTLTKLFFAFVLCSTIQLIFVVLQLATHHKMTSADFHVMGARIGNRLYRPDSRHLLLDGECSRSCCVWKSLGDLHYALCLDARIFAGGKTGLMSEPDLATPYI